MTERTVPFAVTEWDRIPAQRYHDAEFFELEKKHLWTRVWQMACRLEEIPDVGDYVVYRNLDQSVIVIRTEAEVIKAYHNHCRHRGAELVNSSGKARGGFMCPFHGWRWDRDGNSTFVFQPETFSPRNLCDADLALRPVRVETWGGCAFINLDADALPLVDCLGEFAPHMDLYMVGEMKVEWWAAARVPVNWKLAMEAFQEGYHVATTHPQLLPPGTSNRPGESVWFKLPDEAVRGAYWTTVPPQMPDEVDPAQFIEGYLHFMNTLHTGMAGMIAKEEIEIAETLRGMDLPRDPAGAMRVWRAAFNAAVTRAYNARGIEIGDLDAIDSAVKSISVNFAFPNFFLLPMHTAASSYRIRPLGPEECLFELWSLKRYPADEVRPIPRAPEPKPHDDPSWPPIPAQDYSNLPRQQRGLHTGGFDYMRLSDLTEGVISNYHRLIDGYLAGEPDERLVAAVRNVSGPIDREVLDLGVGPKDNPRASTAGG